MIRTRGLLLAAVLLLSTFGGAALAADADADYKALLGTWKAKEYVRALGLAEAFAEAHPDYKFASGALYMGGSAGLRSKRYERAEVFYRELIRRFPDYNKTLGARNELVTTLSRARKLVECIEQCDANLAAAPDAKLAYRWVEAAYKGWLAKHEGHLLEPNARYRLGKAYVYAGRYEEGRKWLRKVVDEDHDRSSICDDAAYWLATSFEREGREDEAKKAFGALLRDYSWAASVRKNVKGDWKAAGPVTEGE